MARRNKAGEYSYQRTARIRGREHDGRYAVIHMDRDHARVVRRLPDGSAPGPGELVRAADVLDIKSTHVVLTGQRGTITLPLELRRSLGIEEGTPLELIQEEDGSLSVRPLSRSSALGATADLNALLAQVTHENLHAEIDAGDAVGREAW